MASGGLTGHSCHRHRRRSPGNPASGPIASWGARGTCPTEVLSRCTERRIRPSPRTAPPPARCSKRITASVPRVFRHLQYSSQKGLHRGRRGGGATSFTRICGSICSEAGSCFGDPGHPFRRSWTPVPAILDTRSGQSWTPVPAILDTRSGQSWTPVPEILDTRSGDPGHLFRQSWTPVPEILDTRSGDPGHTFRTILDTCSDESAEVSSLAQNHCPGSSESLSSQTS
jgi:hypothetical protein